MRLWNDRRLRLVLTRLGFQYLLLTVGLGLFAVHTGNNLLYALFALLLGVFLVSGWASVRALRGVRLVGIEEGNIFARVKGGVRLHLEDAHPRRPRGLEVLLHRKGHAPAQGFYPGGRGATPRVTLHVLPDRRGWRPLEELELRTRYPFGFMEKSHRIPLHQSILVLPHPRAARLRMGDAGLQTQQKPQFGSTSPEASRPFRLGDSPRRVHWKRTAQRGEPWVRTFEEEQPLGIRLELDLRAFEPGPDFERELERLSGILLQARIHRQRVTLILRGTHGRRVVEGILPGWRALAVAEAEGVLPEAGFLPQPSSSPTKQEVSHALS